MFGFLGEGGLFVCFTRGAKFDMRAMAVADSIAKSRSEVRRVALCKRSIDSERHGRGLSTELLIIQLRDR